MIRQLQRQGRDESGAVAVIVALTILVLFAFVVLTVDVGGLLLERRNMVNASDAAALAAAQSCSSASDTSDPETQADTYATSNAKDAVTTTPNITQIVGCDSGGGGHVSVRYTEQHPLFFAPVLGLGNQGTITTAATAAWGPIAGGRAIPLAIDMGYLQGTCKVPDGIDIGETCPFWYNNKDPFGGASWGYMNLDQWNVAPTDNCSNAGSSKRGGWINGGYPTDLTLNGDPPGTGPTYVCNDTGHTTDDWMDLENSVGQIKLFPVNSCDGQLDKTGQPAPCPLTPDKYDIVGFTSLMIKAVYRGDDPLAVGTTGFGGTCATKNANTKNWTTNQSLDLDAITSATSGWAGCSSSPTDTAVILPSDVTITAGNGNPYVQCPPPGTAGCAYTYDPTYHVVNWVGPDVTGTSVSFNWKFADSPGACGTHTPDPNAVCLVTEWRGFTTGPGPIGGGKSFGVNGIKLCDLNYKAGCPDTP
jgi:Flp pilus assembly protein TadG